MAEPSALLIFAPTESVISVQIADLVGRDSTLPASRCPVCTSAAMLRGALTHVPRERCLAVLLAARSEELDQMVALSGWLQDLPIILMIPDSGPETIAKAHRLRPRYLTGPQVDWGELCAVIRQILLQSRKPAPPEPQSPPALLVALKGKNDRFFRIRQTT